jgi:ABC-type lipoprotein export system ATPase subunit
VAVTHEKQLADAADRIIHLHAGQVVETPE